LFGRVFADGESTLTNCQANQIFILTTLAWLFSLMVAFGMAAHSADMCRKLEARFGKQNFSGIESEMLVTLGS
jgi:hypothetical protein